MALYYIPQYGSTTLNVVGGLDNSQTTGIIATSVPSDIDITKPGIVCLTYTNPINTTNAEWITYTSIDGSNEFQGVTRGAEGFAAKTHSNGCTIAWVVSKSHINNVNDKLTGVDATLASDIHGNEVIKTAHVDSAVNEVTITNAATTVGPTIASTGETNVPIILAGKGTGAVKLGQATSTDVRLVADQPIADSAGNELIKFTKTTSAVNEIGIANAATGAFPTIYASGEADTGIDFENSEGEEILKLDAVATAVNEVTITNAATGEIPSISATGGDDNVSLKLVPKGTGAVAMWGNNTGWIHSLDTWVYVSASSFKIEGKDKTYYYTRGTRVRWTDSGGGPKYGVVISSAFSTDTTVNIAVNTDYTISNSAITDNRYSYQANPTGYPTWFSYTCTVGAAGGTVPTYTLIDTARYSLDGFRCSISIMKVNTSGGTAGSGTDALTLSLPITANASFRSLVNGLYRNSTTYANLGGLIVATATTIQLYDEGGSFIENDQNNSARELYMSGFYEI